MRRVIIMGAAGRDFHNFNVLFRNNPEYRVVAFTATQIPYIENRVYPPELAGENYPEGIKIYSEERLEELIREYKVDEVIFSYSDVSHEDVMHAASRALAAGASFVLVGRETQLEAKKPVISILAVRTGAGKSTISRMVTKIIKAKGLRPVVLRHPMPYGKFVALQHFKSIEDLNDTLSVEEEEEYIMHLYDNTQVFAGVDYKLILDTAENVSDIIVWDGGNNDLSFIRSDLNIVVVDPLRIGHESRYHPGETNVRMADAIVVNKVNIADPLSVEKVINSCTQLNPHAKIFKVASEATLDMPDLVRGKRVLVIEDGPSITHGELGEGVGANIARSLGCKLVDPREYAVGTIKKAYEKFPWIRSVLPALGYSKQQLDDLKVTIESVECDAVILGTPADLRRRIRIKKPVARVVFNARDAGEPSFSRYIEDAIKDLAKERKL